MKIVEVAINISSYKQFSYKTDYENCILKRVKIPFGRVHREGIVTNFTELSNIKFKVKKINEILDKNNFTNHYHYEFLKKIRYNFLAPIGKILFLSYPPFYEFKGKIKFSDSTQKKSKAHLNIGFNIKDIIFNIKKDIEQGKNIKLIFPDYYTLKIFSRKIKNIPNLKHGKIYAKNKNKNFWLSYLKKEFNIISGILYPLFIPDYKDTVVYLIDEGPQKFSLKYPFPINLRDLAFFHHEYKNTDLKIFSIAPSIKTYDYITSKNGNLNYENHKKNNVYLTPVKKRTLPKEIKQEIKENFPRKILLIVNRNANKKYLFCPKCRTNYRCEDDNTPLRFDSDAEKVFCPSCGKQWPYPMKCKLCGTKLAIIRGTGTNSIKRSLKKFLPESDIQVYSRKYIGKSKQEEKLINNFKNGKTNILLGTNVALKHFSFKDISLIVYFYPEIDLKSDNPEDSEKIYYNLTAMTKMLSEHSKLIIKTDYPSFYIIDAFKKEDYKHFFEIEKNIRKKLEYFPFTNFVLINSSMKNKSSALKKSRKFKEILKNFNNIEVFGPFYKKRGAVNVFSIILKSKDLNNIIKTVNNRIIPISDSSTSFMLNRLN